ncbi:peptide-methionine (S)-S-oxide reductase [Candidatus Curtissbacteria bacterium RIFCSPLOWO2_02_FULL_40_13b]|uniref:Peptide methionine sulfoxide reductase MsrA n=3 Tax=Candidatus Curtissiibacteriota TaxID=1752717 RepID=A0A1F5HV50_9BACT|nr:MAG: peptide-methionine (S)-S-oxide reductase [Candidatus Curtissbacteria bacterium RIFCSPHIGHO2_01_FULL_40_12]OGE03364.1 MAG: peptide-methionine (S)-S-oxide reductase [Candidatus Curtissbacteria bacterium RIFCSPHIGHO2_12_FULL_41_17]OGE08038.1 MAG: peptide-methionine (S)-S-oxide reductase [Candidatus Curtissbacteria bacterium RIFCSPLOWO2_02_FULL_40_13b]
METATLAGGCFWCTEAIFKRLKGVTSVVSGYTGGNVENPSYEEVCGGDTGHAEAIQITFDPKVVPYEKLLEIFFALHDPTTLNRQGNDAGTQYRSAIFYHDQSQKEAAEKSKANAQKKLTDKIVTGIVPYTEFYEAENYHKNYYDSNRAQGYCQVVIDPKIKKLLSEYKMDVKGEYLG